MDPGYLVAAAMVIAAVWLMRSYERFMVTPKRPPLKPTSVRTAADGEAAERRASGVARRGQTVFPLAEVIAPLGVFEREETFRAAYELMVRGIDARLVVFPRKGVMAATGFYRARWGAAGRALSRGPKRGFGRVCDRSID